MSRAKPLALLSALALTAPLAAQSPVDLSGTWVARWGNQQRIDVITQQGSSLGIRRTIIQGGDTTVYHYRYAIDGKPHVNHINDLEYSTVLHWEAASLVLFTRAEDYFTQSDWMALSPDGSKLTVVRVTHDLESHDLGFFQFDYVRQH